MPKGRLNIWKFTYLFTLYCIPESDRPVGSPSNDFGSLGRPRNSPNLLLSNKSGIQFGQFLSAWLVKVEDVDLSIVEAASEEIVSRGVEVHASDRSTLVVP